MRSNASLGSSREVAQGCGVSCVNCLYLVPLIIGQNFCATSNQTEPMPQGSKYIPRHCLVKRSFTVDRKRKKKQKKKERSVHAGKLKGAQSPRELYCDYR